MPPPRSFCLLSPEYPPASGGVASYVERVATGLAEAGDQVSVWAPSPARDSLRPRVHALPSGFDAAARRRIEASAPAGSGVIRVLQYVPQAFGGLAPGFLRWVTSLPSPLWVMFHEVVYPFERGQTLRRHALAVATRGLAAWLLHRADRVLTSTPSWDQFLIPLGPRGLRPAWLPVTSNLPETPSGRPRRDVLGELGLPEGAPIVAHFGTFGELTATPLRGVLETLVPARQDLHVVLVGRGSREFSASLPRALASRLLATGELPVERIADIIGAADVIVLPFPDGVTTRRTTVMAALALGRPIVTNDGRNTEWLWRGEGCVALTGDAPEAMARRALELLEDPSGRLELGARARAVYEERFCLARLVSTLHLLADG